MLQYALEQAPVEQRIAQQSAAQKLPLPPKIANAPQLAQGLEFYYHAFMDLHTCRSSGMDIGPVAWRDIDAYAIRFDLHDEQAEDLFAHIRAMDNAYLAWARKPAKK